MTRTDTREPKLPVQQLVILSICRFAEPVASTSVFPYLPEMIESFHVPKNKVAKWAGITSAAFSFSQALTAITWGRLADRIGRKPTILAGLFCTLSASILFGFSQSLQWAIIARALGGASSGNVGILRTTVAEMVPERELQPRAFSIMPLVFSIGSILGPVLGGALAKPADNLPAPFRDNPFWEHFPFALPNLVISIFFLVGATTGFLFLKETLQTKRDRPDIGRRLGQSLLRLLGFGHQSASGKAAQLEDSSTSCKDNSASTANDPPPSYREVFSRQSSINLVNYTILALHAIAYDQVLPVFLHMPPPEAGEPAFFPPFAFAYGFGLDHSQIGALFAIFGVMGMLFQFLVFPPVARRYGVLRCLRVVMLCYPIIYFFTPFAVLCPTPLTQKAAVLASMTAKSFVSCFAFPCTTIMLVNSATSLRLLGTLNGVATATGAIGRASGPALIGSAFSLGADLGYVVLAWWLLALIAAIGFIPTLWLVEMPGYGEKDGEEVGEANDEAAPLLQEAPADTVTPESYGTVPPPRQRNSVATSEPDLRRINEDGELAVDEADSSTGLTRAQTHDHSRPAQVERPLRRMSSPIGQRSIIGPGGARLSNGLGQTMCGQGAGGASFQ